MNLKRKAQFYDRIVYFFWVVTIASCFFFYFDNYKLVFKILLPVNYYYKIKKERI